MLDDLIGERLKKLHKIEAAKLNPYPAKAERTMTVAEARRKFGALIRSKKKIALAGRLTGLRDQGSILFLDLADESGKIQLVVKKENLKDFDFWQSVLDIGDFAEAQGTLFKTKKGEESLEVGDFRILAKSLRPLPSDWYGLEETETRLRRRYLDILSNAETREIFQKKAVFWDSFRDYLKKEGFLEVETPVLEAIPGGAEAEPFQTHHNALDTDFYLRISLELPLKKLLVAGYEKVFEIGRIFRNEGIDKEHLQDYTQLEFYWAYRDYNDLMRFLEALYKHVIKKICGTLTTTYGGQKINWGKKWPKLDYVEEFKKETGLNPITGGKEDLISWYRAYAAKQKTRDELITETAAGKGKIIDMIFKRTVRPKLIQPCFLINPPVDVEPLAKRSAKDPRVVERVQIMAGGTELGKGFSELNDPIDQRKRFEEQMKLRAAGDREAQRLDEEYLEAMEYGLPPAAGFGVSERLFAVIMDKPVRETVIFPLMRTRDKK